jgi:hypothetical protein
VSGEDPERPAREVLFEITQLGDVQRVAAVDAATGVEVVIQAPASAAWVDVRTLALRKLERALAGPSAEPLAPGPGKVV